MTDLASYLDAGFALVPVAWGEKRPSIEAWNKRENVICRPEQLASNYTGNIGLAHAYCQPSPTAAFDIDDIDETRAFLEVRGIILQDLLDAADGVQIISGKEGRAKLLYRLPEGHDAIQMVTWKPNSNGANIGTAFELRCATRHGLTVQDIIPPSIHPDTGKPYQWGGKGDWRNLPEMPSVLLKIWESLLDSRNSRVGEINRAAIASIQSQSGLPSEIPDHIKPLLQNPNIDPLPLPPSPDEMATILHHLVAQNAFTERSGIQKNDAGRIFKVGWIEAGMALKVAYGDSVGFDLWSHTHIDERARNDAPGQWESFASDAKPGHVTIGTLLRAANDTGLRRFADRRKEQRNENVAIGRGGDNIPTQTVYTLEEMVDRFVFIKDGAFVGDALFPSAILSLSDFRNATAGSKTPTTKSNGAPSMRPTVQAWLEDPRRKQVDTITFHAGYPLITNSPQGRLSLNTWITYKCEEIPNDWSSAAAIFVEHIRWLWASDADEFLNWLAHIEQNPGELPHFGWVHISAQHGTGRNWVSSVISRLWSGYVAASLDLVGLIEGRFNDRLSRCLIAIVDEIAEGGSNKHRHANTLRQMVTAEVRELNPKYGKRSVEFNQTRWLLFSNHTGAIPLDENDRRFWVVRHDFQPKTAEYYEALYSRLHQPDFITSVKHFLRQRDISNFKPGQRPPMNNAKRELVDFSASEEDELLKEVASNWPVDVITGGELRELLFPNSSLKSGAARHAMDRAGIKKLGKLRLGSYSDNVYSIRRHDHWISAKPEILRAEIDRIDDAAKRRAL